MRAMLAAVVVMLTACGPAVAPKPPSFDEDFSTDRAPAATPTATEQPAPSAAATTSAEPSACPPKAKNCTTRRPTVATSVIAMQPLRDAAKPGKGVRTGTIDRAHLVAVLDGGPSAFLGQLEVSARLDGDRFVGWQLVQLLDRESPLADLDLAPGDVLFAINGKPVGKPDQVYAVWESLRTANQIVADLSRGDTKVQLVFDVEPKI